MRRNRDRGAAARRAENAMADMDRRLRRGETGDLWSTYDRELLLLHSPLPALLLRCGR